MRARRLAFSVRKERYYLLITPTPYARRLLELRVLIPQAGMAVSCRHFITLLFQDLRLTAFIEFTQLFDA
jgi:hypothetical protein